MEPRMLTAGFSWLPGGDSYFNIEERTALQIGIAKIRSNEGFKDVFVWGKVKGLKKDYIILYALKTDNYEFPIKKFFWSTDGHSFAELPEIDAAKSALAMKLQAPFTGEPDSILIEAPAPAEAPAAEEGAEEKSPEEQEAAAEAEAAAQKAKNVTELDRLCYTVRAIDHDTAVIPKGSYMLSSAHNVVPAMFFEGLKLDEAVQLSSYQHLRKAEGLPRQAVLTSEESIFQNKFLDSLDSDEPRGCWSIHSEDGGAIVNVRSLLWPGYTAFHMTETRAYGALYMGDGLRFNDLPFIL